MAPKFPLLIPWAYDYVSLHSKRDLVRIIKYLEMGR